MAKTREEQRIRVEDYTFSEGELEWASKNIGYMQSFLTGNRLQNLMLAITFAVGLALYAIAQLISNGVLTGSPVVADFLYNLGITLWTSVVLAFLLEVLVDRQRRFTERYLLLVREALRQRGESALQAEAEPDEVETAANGATLAQQKLDAVLEKLKAMDDLKSEVAALRSKLDAK
jgi:hypothetical protein